MPDKPDYEFSEHARLVVIQRGIDVEWVERVLRNPEWTRADKVDGHLTHAIGRIAEHGDRYLRVVYNSAIQPCRIVSVFFDRRVKGKR
jgi:hypothetical protein